MQKFGSKTPSVLHRLNNISEKRFMHLVKFCIVMVSYIPAMKSWGCIYSE